MDIDKIIADAVEKAVKDNPTEASFQPSPKIQAMIDKAIQQAVRNVKQKE